MTTQEFGQNLIIARDRVGFSQRQLADAIGAHQGTISDFEQGKRFPSHEQWLKLCGVLKVSLQWFLSGSNHPGGELADIAFQLHELGIADLHVENARVPGAFRPAEEVVALALAGAAPPARIVEALPAVLAWNQWNPFLLRTYGRIQGKQVENRIGWLADIVVKIDQTQGFPGGCESKKTLEAYIKHVQAHKEGQAAKEIDRFGFSGKPAGLPPVTLHWHIYYPAPLAVFHARAERLAALRRQRARRP